MSKRSASRPVPSEEEMHPFRPTLPLPSWAHSRHMHRAPLRTPQEVLQLADQRLRVAEILRGNCQVEELLAWRKFAQEMLQLPFRATWTDPDEEGSSAVEVLVLEVLDNEDRRGVLAKCSIVGTHRLRNIPLESLVVCDVAAVPWSADDAQLVADRVLSDYRFWVNELHGLDPSSQYFDDGEGLPGADDVVFDLGSDHDEDEASLFSLDPEHEEMSGSGGPQLGDGNDEGALLGLEEDFDDDMGDFMLDDDEEDDGSDFQAGDHSGEEWHVMEGADQDGDNWKIAYSDSDHAEDVAML